MRAWVGLLLAGTTMWGSTALAQSSRRDPHLGYLYPAGGQRGTTFEITAGGQNLRGVSGVHVSGPGVRATIVEHYRPVRNVDRRQREALQRRMRELAEQRLAEDRSRPGGTSAPGIAASRSEAPAAAEAGELPAHPLLRNLEDMSLRELQHVRHELLHVQRRQRNAQIAESVVIAIAIDAGAAPGDREIRLRTPLGLTNPMCFQVGLLPEIRELEPNDPQAILPDEPPLELPILINGQVMPGDVDRFHFRARQGQRLVIQARARHLIPYLADAVPGWFQATLALYDASGREVAFAGEYRFHPDPVLFYEVPEDGVYRVEIRDSIYRGREDFIYRLAIGEQPFVTEVFPLGGRLGSRTVAAIDGWNLLSEQLALSTLPGDERIRQAALSRSEEAGGTVTYAVDLLPEVAEIEPNDTLEDAQLIELPRIINGRIGEPGDVDVFKFTGRRGAEVVAEVNARRLGSPLDSLLRLLDAAGQVLEWNDDHDDMESGLLTHHADSYLRARLPEDGEYYIQVSDAQHQGGPEYAYRLRISPPRPDFALRVTPSTVNVRPPASGLVHVHAVRKDGFEGEIEVVLSDETAGFALGGGRIPAGRDRAAMTLAARGSPPEAPVVLQLEGRSRIRGQLVRRPAIPSEDMTQAFLYRHLVPARELVVEASGARRPVPPLEVIESMPIRITAGSAAEVRMSAPRHPMLRTLQFELFEAPAGIKLDGVNLGDGGLTLTLSADQDVRMGLAENLIVEVLAEAPGRQGQKQQVSVGVLPAIPIEVTGADRRMPLQREGRSAK